MRDPGNECNDTEQVHPPLRNRYTTVDLIDNSTGLLCPNLTSIATRLHYS